MTVAVVDTGVLIETADADDDHHDVATEIVCGMDHGDLPTGRVTNYIGLETLDWIHTREHHKKAVETDSRLNQSAGFEVRHSAQKDFTNAIDRFQTDEGPLFGHGTIAAYMAREEIKHLYSSDDGSDTPTDITRLDTADNPFE